MGGGFVPWLVSGGEGVGGGERGEGPEGDPGPGGRRDPGGGGGGPGDGARGGGGGGGGAGARHVAASRSARLTALRTRGSLSCAVRSSTARASGVRILPSAIAAQARVSGSSFLASRPLGASIFSSTAIPFPPTSEPKASKNAIFSVRSAFLSLPPVTAPSTRVAALR